MAVDPILFKQALSQWASGVTVVTTLKNGGQPHGMTASSVTSLSLDPPMVLICVAKKLYTHTLLEESGFFAVNILNMDQLDYGKRFAGMYPDMEDRFAGIDYHAEMTGAPILPGVLGWVDCRLTQTYTGGDHTIFLGEVLAAAGPGDHDPLLYFNRQWGSFESALSDS
jgi:flavin reductase (DIM6/NTAB) family NADH-FMN oxidoreductase RutF